MKSFHLQRQPHASDDPQIKVVAPLENGAGFRRMIFPLSRIDSLFECSEAISAIRLLNGAVIPVALTLDELQRRVYEDNTDAKGMIDLTALTGEAAQPAERVSFVAQFNKTADQKSQMKIILYGRPDRVDRGYRRLEFAEADIRYQEPNIKSPQNETFIELNKEVDGVKSVFIIISLPDFLRRLNEARTWGLDVIDLSEITRPQDGRRYDLIKPSA